MAPKPKKRSPLKSKPLRTPGQSLAEARRRVWDEYGQTPALVTACLLMLTLVGALEAWQERAVPYLVWGVLALLALAWFIVRIIKAQPKLHALRQGEEGERAVGQYLEKLRSEGYEVFHDLIGEGFNVDHVIIGPAGVSTIETKTWSKPAQGQPKIQFNGQGLTLPAQTEDRRPIIQAKAQAAWLRQLLEESTGRKLSVHPVVLFPGWFVESKKGALNSIWVLEPKALPKFLANQPQKLSTEEIKLFSFHLSRWIRAEEGSRLQKHR